MTTFRATPPLPAAFAVGIAFSSAIVVTASAVAVGATRHPAAALLALAVLTAAVSMWTTCAGAVATAWICWALESGFVVGRQAQLSFSPLSQQALLLLLAVGLLAGIGGQAARRHRSIGVQAP